MAGSPYYTSRNWYNCDFKFRLASGPLYGFRKLKEFRALCAELTWLVGKAGKRTGAIWSYWEKQEMCLFRDSERES